MVVRDARCVYVPPDEMLPQERACWLALTRVEGLGPVGVWNLVEEHGSAHGAWLSLEPRRRKEEPLSLLQSLARPGMRIVTPVDAGFPRGLLDLHDPPGALFMAGTPLPRNRLKVAVVGSRNATPYGLSVAERLSRDLAMRGLVVVSGLALGVDGAAHRGALAGGGPTVAVLGCGLDRDYPREHRRLRDAIEAQGLVVSEYPPGTEPDPWRFPARNRLIAAMSHGVVVVQAARKSGALITADLASEIGREVMAVPGQVGDPTAVGCLNHLKEGAYPVCDAQDVLDALKHVLPPVEAPPGPEGDLGRLLEALGASGGSVDDLARRTSLAAGAVSAGLLQLQVEGLVRRLPTGRWIRVG